MNIDKIIVGIDPDNDYTIAEIKGILPISGASINNAIIRGKLKGRKIFNKYYVKGTDLQDFLLGNR
jgi:hypothetical protein